MIWKITDNRKLGNSPSLWERFVNRIDTDPNVINADDCVNWSGFEGLRVGSEFKAHILQGPCKGFISVRPSLIAPFRLSWEMANGPMPDDGMDYAAKRICSNSACCNPHHLELVPRKKPKTIRKPDPETVGFWRRLPIWLWPDGQIFNRDAEIASGFTYIVYKFINKRDHKTYIGMTNISRRSSSTGKTSEDFTYYSTSTKNEKFKNEIKHHPERFIRQVLSLHRTKKEAEDEEERLTLIPDARGVPYWKTEESYNLNPGGSYAFGSGENNPMFGKTHTSEARQAISEANMGNQNAKGHRKTEKQKAAIGARTKKLWQDPAYVEMMQQQQHIRKTITTFKGKEFSLPSVNETAIVFGVKKNDSVINLMIKGKNKTFNATGIKIRYAGKNDADFPEMPDEVKVAIKKIMKVVHKTIADRKESKPVRFEYDGRLYVFENRHVFYDWLKGDFDRIPITYKMIEDWTISKRKLPEKCGMVDFRYAKSNESTSNAHEPDADLRKGIIKKYIIAKTLTSAFPCLICNNDGTVDEYEDFYEATAALGLKNHNSVMNWVSGHEPIPVSRSISSISAVKDLPFDKLMQIYYTAYK